MVTKYTHDKGVGRPSTAITEDNIECASDMVLLDRRVTIDEVAHVLQINHGSANEMMHNKLGFHKVCARCVPKQLTEVHKQTRVDIWRKHLDRYGNKRDIFLDKIITVTKHGSIITIQRVNGRVWNGNIHNRLARKSLKPKNPQENWCLQCFGTHKAQYGNIIRRGAQQQTVRGTVRCLLTGWSLQFEANAEDYCRKALICYTTMSIHILLLNAPETQVWSNGSSSV